MSNNNPANPNTESQQALARRAAELSRRLYISMPWGYRVAGLLLVLAGDSLDTFGRATYAEMIKAVVRGMPETADGRQALDLVQDVASRGAEALPSGYGRQFAARVFKVLLTKFSDPEAVEEAMARVLVQIARKKIHVRNGSDLREAESLFLTVALNAARDYLRTKSRRREDSLTHQRDEEAPHLNIEDPESFRQLEEVLPERQLQTLINELAAVHPRAPQWLRARLEGQTGQEIAQAWGTTPSWVSKWQRMYLPQVQQVVVHNLRSAQRVVSYDYRRFVE